MNRDGSASIVWLALVCSVLYLIGWLVREVSGARPERSGPSVLGVVWWLLWRGVRLLLGPAYARPPHRSSPCPGRPARPPQPM